MTAYEPPPEEQAVEQPTIKKRIPVPFCVNVPANQAMCLVSAQIPYGYVVTRVQTHFPDNAINQLQVWMFASGNSNPSTTAPPPDNKLLGFYSPTPYHLGNGEIIDSKVYVEPAENERYLKVYFANFNAWAVGCVCIITIETPDLAGEIIPPVMGGFDETKLTYEEWRKLFDLKANVLQDIHLDMTGKTPPWLDVEKTEESRASGETKEFWEQEASKLATMTSYLTPSMHNDEFVPAMQKWFEDANELMSKYSSAEIIGELSGLGFIDVASPLVARDELTWQIGHCMGKINQTVYEQSIYEYTRQSANIHFLAKIPATADLINMAVKEKITVARFQEEMKKQGFSLEWSDLIWQAHFIAPDYDTIKRAINRGLIPWDDKERYLKLVDLDPYYNEKAWIPLLDEIVPYQELVNQRVKEVITQQEFEKGLAGWGYRGDSAENIWKAHFTPPQYEDFLTAMRRKLTVTFQLADGTTVNHKFGEDLEQDINIIHQLSVLADYDPRYDSFFDTRIYNDPTPRMARWAFEVGALNPEQVEDIVHRFGYPPADEAWFTKMLLGFQERPYVTKYLTAIMTAYIKGAIDEAELKKRVVGANRNEAIADWIVKIADVRKEIADTKTVETQQKLLSLTELKKAYFMNHITEQKLRTELQLRNYETADIQVLLDVMNTEKEQMDVGGKKHGLTTTELLDAYRYSLKTEDEVRTELMLRGCSLSEAQLIIDIKKKKWGVEAG